jgi:hypothetical protein
MMVSNSAMRVGEVHIGTRNFVLIDATIRTQAADRRSNRSGITQAIVNIGGAVAAATFEFQ